MWPVFFLLKNDWSNVMRMSLTTLYFRSTTSFLLKGGPLKALTEQLHIA